MTTIAFRDGVLAADTGVVDGGGTFVGRTIKIAKSPNGAVMGGAAGLESDTFRFVEWIKRGADESAMEDFLDADGEGILITREGEPGTTEFRETVRFMDKHGMGGPVSADFHAIGGGFKFALGAMAVGASAADAVRAAAAMDPGTHMPVTVLSFDE